MPGELFETPQAGGWFTFPELSLLNSGLQVGRLEIEPQSKLHPPHECVVGQAGDRATTAAINAAIRIGKISMVKHVVEFRAELNLHLFMNREPLDNRKIAVEPLGAEECVAARVPESTKRWTLPGSESLAIGRQNSAGRSY